jgi:hypothetical protein
LRALRVVPKKPFSLNNGSGDGGWWEDEKGGKFPGKMVSYFYSFQNSDNNL